MKLILTFLFLSMIQYAYSQECFLLVSNGGGFAGTATVYKISLDGMVLKGKGLGQINYNEQSKLKKSIARKYYRKAKTLVGSTPDFDHPGNIYYSIATLEKDTENKMTWGDTEHSVPEQAKNLYQEITKTLTALTFSENTTK